MSRNSESVEQVTRRENENRRITIIVIPVVIVFLIHEIPYGVFLLASVIGKHTKAVFDLEKNRAIHAAYDLLLVISFQANFYIYTFLNRRFRDGLRRMLLIPRRQQGLALNVNLQNYPEPVNTVSKTDHEQYQQLTKKLRDDHAEHGDRHSRGSGTQLNI